MYMFPVAIVDEQQRSFLLLSQKVLLILKTILCIIMKEKAALL